MREREREREGGGGSESLIEAVCSARSSQLATLSKELLYEALHQG